MLLSDSSFYSLIVLSPFLPLAFLLDVEGL
uniref:Uncharacterized protein n=1 Tax=Anguilla anguilla TaxID=7936 RepID=A0A0E9SJA4_ANGAN